MSLKICFILMFNGSHAAVLKQLESRTCLIACTSEDFKPRIE